MSRKIEDLTPSMQEKVRQFTILMADAGLPFIITCTYRSQAEQNELYKQGRSKPGLKVTWTTNSRHTDRDAFDIAIVKDGNPVWDVKVNVNINEIPDYLEAGQIGESIGLVWGGRWGKPDYPHYQEA